eukprot:14438525-Alexandrium_andersonii.AAC.1
MAREERGQIGSLRSIHRRRIAGEVLENGVIVVGVPDLVPLEDYAPLELPQRVALVKLGILLDADLKDPADVGMTALSGDAPCFDL